LRLKSDNSERIERRVIAHDAACLGQGTIQQLANHEDWLRNVIRIPYTVNRQTIETETLVIVRVTQNERQFPAHRATSAQPNFDKLPADAASLMRGYHPDGSKANSADIAVAPLDDHRAERDVPDDCLVILGDERYDESTRFSQLMDQKSLRISAKGLLMHEMDPRSIRKRFKSNVRHLNLHHAPTMSTSPSAPRRLLARSGFSDQLRPEMKGDSPR
jgi:hypothetical protein